MIKSKDLIESFDLIDRERFAPMIEQINIPDFYKCIAQLSGLNISEVNDEVIAGYLRIWCENKYKYFKMLGDKVRLDQPFVYNRPKTDLSDQILDLGKEFPAYYLWLKEFKHQEKNKIEQNRYWSLVDYCKVLFPQYTLEGSTMTHFFKSKLNAPDKLVTAIGRLFENDKIEATHTISIDPVDMMFASENPYDWNSCYRLELDRTDSHADGCLAAVLDSNSLITYVWSSEGQYDMYGMFKFKKVRYYRMRQWIAIANDWGAIHFNFIYPGKSYDNDMEKLFREVVEEVVSKHTGIENIWRKNDYIQKEKEEGDFYSRTRYIYECMREFYYGYGEYRNDNIYINSEINPKKEVLSKEEYMKLETNEDKKIRVYNEKILCPCGCGVELMGSDECGEDCDDEYEYNGEGFIAENFYEKPRYYCEYKGDDCEYECDGDCCDGCCYWEDAHPYCDECGMECPEGMDAPDIYDGYAHPDETCKKSCPHWRDCHSPCSLDKENILCGRTGEVSSYEDDDTGEEICHANCADCAGCSHWEKHKNEKGDAENTD